MKKDIHIVNLKKQKKYISAYYFLIYIQYELINVESPKYKVSCLKSSKSSAFAFFLTNMGQKSLNIYLHHVLTTLIFKNSQIHEIKS